jgi:peptidoglycan/LPS O-acetylase OafA/YrhL
MDPGLSVPASNHDHQPPYFPLFDFLRITLALGVFVSHANVFSLSVYAPNLGDFCVQVFFALSGFLIGGILRDSTANSLPRFYFNRSTRIWIPYGIALLLLAGACFVKHQPLTAKLAEFFFDKATFTYNFFGEAQLPLREFMPLQGTGRHFWSICVEEQFYLVAPLIIMGLRRHAAWGIAALGTIASWRYPGFFASITLGVLLALSERRFGKWYRHVSVLAAGSLALIGLALAGFLRPHLYEVVTPLASVIIIILLSGTGSSSPAGQFLGGISFPFYLNHWVGLVFVKQIMAKTGMPPVAAAAVALLIVLVYSTAHYLTIDRLIRRRRGLWFSERLGFVCALSGFALVGLGVIVNLVWLRAR